MRVIVTGANGFIGTQLCAFLRQNGHAVTACVRNAAHEGEIATGDLATFDGWEDLLQNADAVIHLAARVHQIKETAVNPDAAFYSANVDATRRLLKGCEQCGVRRFIFLSTIAVLGADSAVPNFGKNRAPYNPYSRSKAEAEALVESSELNWTILRIPLVYGAGVRANFLSLIRAVQRGIPFPLGLVKNRRSVLYIENLTEAFLHLLPCEKAFSRILFVADKSPISSADLIRSIAHGLGITPHILPVPSWIIRIATYAIGKPMIYKKLCGNLFYSTNEIQEMLDWTPPYSTHEAIEKMLKFSR
jgi:nucleoside-diphosphate-sugar epimerase